MDDQPHNATESTYSPTTRLVTSLPDRDAQLERDAGTHCRDLIFVWMLPFLKANDLSSLCRTSRDICTLTRADLFRRTILKTEEAAATFCRTINEDPVIPAIAHCGGLGGRRLLCGNGEPREVKGLGWHMRMLVLSFKLDCELNMPVIQS